MPSTPIRPALPAGTEPRTAMSVRRAAPGDYVSTPDPARAPVMVEQVRAPVGPGYRMPSVA
jgi:hypothetical protein